MAFRKRRQATRRRDSHAASSCCWRPGRALGKAQAARRRSAPTRHGLPRLGLPMECYRGCSHALRTIWRHCQTQCLIFDVCNARRAHIGGVQFQLRQRCLVFRSWRKQFLHTDHPLNSAHTHRPNWNISFGGQRRRSSGSGAQLSGGLVATCKETTRNHYRGRKSAHAPNFARSRQMSKWCDHLGAGDHLRAMLGAPESRSTSSNWWRSIADRQARRHCAPSLEMQKPPLREPRRADLTSPIV